MLDPIHNQPPQRSASISLAGTRLEEDLPCDPAELHPYFTSFHRHVRQIREHLQGISHQNACSSSTIGNVLWTAAEKDAFFHALSVYSRFRPDLIAVCVGTKNEVEVLEYLAILEEGSRDYRAGESRRSGLPIAHQVSDPWIIWEEDNAERLCANEENWTDLSRSGYGIEDLVDETVGYPDDVQSGSDYRTSLGGINKLTYGHLVVLGSMLKRDEDQQPGPAREASVTPDRNAARRQTGIGSDPPTRITEGSSISPAANGSQERGSSPSPSSHLEPDETQAQGLTPRSRRRYTKRMYMRRKRAQMKGSVPNTTMSILRSGPRKKAAQNNTGSSISTNRYQNPESDKPADSGFTETPNFIYGDQTRIVESDEGDLVDDDPVSVPFATRVIFQGIRSFFSSHDVTAESIVECGLDLFNLPKLGRLLRHFISGYDSDLASEDASVDVDTLQLLSEITRDFLVQVMARVITLEEEQRRLRGTTKVWRKNIDEAGNTIVNASAVQFALKMMGLTKEDKAQYFAELLGEGYEPPSCLKSGYDDNMREIDASNFFHQHPLHQDLCPPYYHVVFPRDQQQSGMAVEEVDNLRDISSDDEELVAELEEEEILDAEDRLADRAYEKSLWKEIRPPKGYFC